MIRRTLCRCAHPEISATNKICYFDSYSELTLRQRLWRRFRGWSRWKKVLFCFGTPSSLAVSYIALCTYIHKKSRPTIDDMFDEEKFEEYVMEDWKKVEPTLREGDIVLLMGTGSMSWKITNTQFVLSCMKPASIRYSHVAVVVEPALLQEAPEKTAAPARGGRRIALLPVDTTDAPTVVRGACMMEAVDNKDVNCPDWKGVVRHDCAQVVEISKRVFGKQGDRPCYHRFAIRRLQGFEWTPERREKLNTFIHTRVGQPMDKSPKLMIAFMWPKLYYWLRVRKGNEISCSELVAELYKTVGIARRPMSFTDVVAESGTTECGELKPSLEVSPCHFAEGLEKRALEFAPGVGLGPEVRISLPRVHESMLYKE